MLRMTGLPDKLHVRGYAVVELLESFVNVCPCQNNCVDLSPKSTERQEKRL